jgi:hypothetical protein
MVLIAKLEIGTCLIVYFGFKSYSCNIPDTMTAIKKIKAQMLVQLLRGENLIRSFRWIFQPDWRSVYSINRFSLFGEGIGKQVCIL